ncbi:diaminopimelate epimerase [Butyrivibrio sp. INlla14]|uniref:diaminopimelate epimerase n=1 Tax=Butyrivibrio sp. INlla14 TaxID=1520808 RepID=UPI000876C423|nr:diaminopimelate epimerase [Butyrivibrio sp. INlla14]SCY01093.1 diaminopimelate epimerase [Butyrivibrio sp. INlla14]
MLFTKMHGCGNDYVYVDGARENIPQNKKSDLAKKVSDRHFGIGSDGLIFINPVSDSSIDFEMEMYNADGSRSEMCGNGIRCVAKYVYDNRLTNKKNLVIVSAGQKKYIDLTVGDDNLVSSVKVDMGAPILTPELVPVSLDKSEANSTSTDAMINAPVTIDGKEWNITCVSMGNPHAVVFLPEDVDLETFDIEAIGPKFENNEIFPNRTNTEFVKVDNRGSVHMRVWERGTGETLACGTGCCATTVACILNGLTDKKVDVHVLGGIVTCTWNGDLESSVIMEGPATTVFTGEISID